MSKPARKGDLEVADDLAFLRRTWKVQRAGWILIALVLLAAVAGVFGSGPVGTASTEAASLALDYARFARRDSPEELRVQGRRSPTGDGVAIGIANRFLDAVEIEAVSPPPLRAERAADRTVYVFARAPGEVRFSLRYKRLGRVHGDVAIGGGEAVAFSTFVYP